MTKEPIFDLKINPEYQNLIDPLTKDEYTSLKNSIKNNGQQLPIIVNRDGVIIDGHHRFKIDLELGIIPRIEVREFSKQSEEEQFIHDCNVERRHLNTFQRIKLKLQRRKSQLQEQIKQNESLGGKGVKILTPLGRVNEQIGKEAGASRTQVSNVEYLLENASTEVQNKLEEGKITIDKAVRELKKQEKRAELIQEAFNNPKIDLPAGFQIIHGDFIEKSKEIEDNSVDLIFTDPLYGKEYLYLYGELGKVAERVLKPGGSLITNANQGLIPKITTFIEDAGLTYWWEFAIKLSGPSFNHFHAKKVSIKWKPLLWFIKGNKVNSIDYVSDFIESKVPDKTSHEYEQSLIEAEHVISILTVENQKIFDPFMGYATTGIAALRLNRKFIGIEIDEEHFKTAQLRIGKELANRIESNGVKN